MNGTPARPCTLMEHLKATSPSCTGPSRTFSHDACPPPGLCRARGQPQGLDSQLPQEEMDSKLPGQAKVHPLFNNTGSLRCEKQI